MYLMGSDHPHKADTVRALERLTTADERLITDAEVFQELLHRYSALGRRSIIQVAFERLLDIVDHVLPIELPDVLAAKDIAATHTDLSARDALHVAVMRHHGVSRILTFDRGYDAVSGIERLPL